MLKPTFAFRHAICTINSHKWPRPAPIKPGLTPDLCVMGIKGIEPDVFRIMAVYTKKNVAFVVTVALGSVALLVPSFAGITDSPKGDANQLGFDTRLNGGPNQAPQPKPRSVQSAANGPKSDKSVFKTDLLFGNDPNFADRAGDKLGIGDLSYKMLVSILLVVVLGAAAIYVSKKLLPRITNLAGKEIRVLETVHLGPRKAVHLLKIGNQKFLIGSTSERITKLANVTDGLTDSSMTERDDY